MSRINFVKRRVRRPQQNAVCKWIGEIVLRLEGRRNHFSFSSLTRCSRQCLDSEEIVSVQKEKKRPERGGHTKLCFGFILDISTSPHRSSPSSVLLSPYICHHSGEEALWLGHRLEIPRPARSSSWIPPLWLFWEFFHLFKRFFVLLKFGSCFSSQLLQTTLSARQRMHLLRLTFTGLARLKRNHSWFFVHPEGNQILFSRIENRISQRNNSIWQQYWEIFRHQKFSPYSLSVFCLSGSFLRYSDKTNILVLLAGFTCLSYCLWIKLLIRGSLCIEARGANHKHAARVIVMLSRAMRILAFRTKDSSRAMIVRSTMDV